MGETFFPSAKSYLKNLAIRARRVVSGVEGPAEVWAGVARDTQKLVRLLLGPKRSASRKEALEWVKKGRAAYNLRNYEAAGKHFRHAATCDAHYALPHLYLGHALYQLGRVSEAMASWRCAIKTEPASQEAETAQRKIRHAAQSANEVLDYLEERVHGR